jgi:hypothetical protein
VLRLLADENFNGRILRALRCQFPERDRGVLPPEMGKDLVRERFDLFRHTLTALHGYRPRPYGGRVTLFRAAASQPPGEAGLTAGWGRLATTDAHLIPDADHHTLLQRPALDRLLESLQSGLALADA